MEVRIQRALDGALARADDFGAGLAAVLAVIGRQAPHWKLGIAWIYDSASNRPEVGASWRGEETPGSALEQAAKLEGPVWFEDLTGLEESRLGAILESGMTRGLALPVSVHGRVVAVLQFFGSERITAEDPGIDLLRKRAPEVGAILEAKRTEPQPRPDPVQFGAVVEAADDGIIWADESGTIRSANEAAHRIFGWEGIDLAGRPVQCLVPERHHGAQQQALERFLETREPRLLGRSVHVPGLRRDGTEFPLELSVTAWEARNRTYFVGCVRDISDRRRAEEELRRSQAALKETHVLARVGSWELDADSGHFEWSPEFAGILGRSDEDAEPSWERFIDAVHPDDRRNLREYVEAAMSGGQSTPFRHRIIRRDGKVRVLQGRASIERDQRGTPCRLRAVSHDVTDITDFESALGRLNRQHALILASASEGIAGVDEQGRTTFLNPAAERMLGWVAGEALGRDAHQTFHHTRHDGSTYPREDCPIVTAFDRGEVTHDRGELFWRRDGTGFPVEYFGAPIRENGEVTGGVLIFRDVSEEAQARQHRDRFEQRLRQTERLESLGRLAGGVAHDFNNMLAAILNSVVVVEDRLPESDPSHKDVREIRLAAERAAALTQQLLLFSRSEDARREVVDLNALVSGMEFLLRRAIPEHGSLDLTLSDEPALIESDPSQIEQVLLNLAVNAGDAISEGGAFQIETEVLGPERDVRLRVRDDGEGMSPEIAARAFEPFFSTKPKGVGTGLGLATVYGVVTQSGGKVELSTEPGRGTEVVAQFPGPSGSPLPAAPQPELRAAQAEASGRTILLVDDDDVVRSLTARILSQADHRVLEVPDPVQALALAERYDGPIDLLLTDMVMPQLSGSELARRLREQRPRVAVLYMSGLPEGGRGGPTLLRKPFTAEDLLAAVRDVDAPG